MGRGRKFNRANICACDASIIRPIVPATWAIRCVRSYRFCQNTANNRLMFGHFQRNKMIREDMVPIVTESNPSIMKVTCRMWWVGDGFKSNFRFWKIDNLLCFSVSCSCFNGMYGCEINFAWKSSISVGFRNRRKQNVLWKNDFCSSEKNFNLPLFHCQHNQMWSQRFVLG